MSVQPRTPKKVTVIPADPQFEEKDIRKKHLRVAPYCRVSTDKDEQLSSYEAQIEYYTEKIAENPDWTMVRMYADEGISGTSAKKRKQFMQMIRDAQHGKIDLVITKSVSRFCRNTLDGLDYVRKLKRYGVGVFFEKENVNTLYMDNEMILTFMMSQAQAESESLSGNVKWGHRKNFQDGKVYYNYNNFLGYRKGPDGEPEIDEEQAAVVRRIFASYLMGQSIRQICNGLMDDGIKTARGNEVWHDSVIQNLLKNEKYVGDALLQKTFSADLFTHQQMKNEGQLPKYYVHDCHPAIIDRETFRRVQDEIARRSSLRKTSSKTKTELGKYCGKYVFSELLVCSECGSPYRRVTLNECLTSALAGEGDELSLPAVTARLRGLQARQMELLRLIMDGGVDCTSYDEELNCVNTEKLALLDRKAELEREGRSADEFDRRIAEINGSLSSTGGAIEGFDEVLVRQLVSNIKVMDQERILVRFKDGTEVNQRIEKAPCT